MNYDLENGGIDSVFQRYKAQYATVIGTTLHEYAETRIKHRLTMMKGEKNGVLMYLLDKGIPRSVIDLDYMYDNLRHYVNDSIGFKMDPEVVLFYSDNCFGTTDAIYFRDKHLRIHDYKSGKGTPHIEQPRAYAALFCLEYGIKPKEIETELYIYHSDEVLEETTDPEIIENTMKQIIELDKIIAKWKAEDKL